MRRPARGPSTSEATFGERPDRDVDVLRRAVSLIEDRLPAGWSTEVEKEARVGDQWVDALVELTAPDRSKAVLVMEAKRSVTPRDLPALYEQISSHAISDQAVPVLVARYLSPSARAWLQDRGISYADATGNLRLVLDRPSLFLADRGADHDPWRGPGRPRGTLKGPAAARVVRALIDFASPVSATQLVSRSGASTGATYRVVEFLEQEALVERAPRGVITVVEWRRLLERWSQDYGFQLSNVVRAYLEPLGLPALLDRLAQERGLRYASTGSLAAQRWAPYAPPRLAMVHVEDPDEAAERLKLRQVDTGANVLLAAGEYNVVFERCVEDNGVTVAAPSQVAVDLLTGPGRSPSEAAALLDWMETHEGAWRR